MALSSSEVPAALIETERRVAAEKAAEIAQPAQVALRDLPLWRELVHHLRQHLRQLAQRVLGVDAQLLGEAGDGVVAQHATQLVGGDRLVGARADPGLGHVTQARLFELLHQAAQATEAAAEKDGAPYEAVVALGCVIRGETGHYDIVAGESSRALMDLSVAFALPLGNGILTVENEAQALARVESKARDAARVAVEMANLMEDLP